MAATFRTPALLMGWLSVVLVLDRAGGGLGLLGQRGLGVLTWVLLVVALRWFTPTVRCQALVVVAVATVVEYVFSPTLEVYLYRFDNVPAYVPPGHGLVYLSAWAFGHTPWVRRHLASCTGAVLAVGGAWAAWGLVNGDQLGAFWFVCLAGFLLWGPSKEVYVGAFVVVSHLELLGTQLGTWVWQPVDPVLGIGIGNPPSGAAGGYGWFDLAGLLLAPYLLAAWHRLRPQPEPPAVGEVSPVAARRGSPRDDDAT